MSMKATQRCVWYPDNWVLPSSLSWSPPLPIIPLKQPCRDLKICCREDCRKPGMREANSRSLMLMLINGGQVTRAQILFTIISVMRRLEKWQSRCLLASLDWDYLMSPRFQSRFFKKFWLECVTRCLSDHIRICLLCAQLWFNSGNSFLLLTPIH